jgi:hypothetical protein
MILDDETLRSVVRGSRIKRSPAGQVTVRRAFSWISEEDEESGWADDELPDRVLHISKDPDGKVSLYTPRGLRGKYAVLSYAPDDMAVEKFDWTTGYIDPDVLPPAFQDAIKMTRKLGLRYLWIDALW